MENAYYYPAIDLIMIVQQAMSIKLYEVNHKNIGRSYGLMIKILEW